MTTHDYEVSPTHPLIAGHRGACALLGARYYKIDGKNALEALRAFDSDALVRTLTADLATLEIAEEGTFETGKVVAPEMIADMVALMAALVVVLCERYSERTLTPRLVRWTRALLLAAPLPF